MPVKYKDATGYGRKHAPELPGTPRQGRHRAVSTVLPGKGAILDMPTAAAARRTAGPPRCGGQSQAPICACRCACKPPCAATPSRRHLTALVCLLRPAVKLGLDGNANVAMELGLREVDKALRLNVGHAKDDEGARKAYPPDTDFECWGWMSKKGGVRRNWLER